jgi:hypothetical protein
MLRQPTRKMAALKAWGDERSAAKNRFPKVAVDGPRNYPSFRTISLDLLQHRDTKDYHANNPKAATRPYIVSLA